VKNVGRVSMCVEVEGKMCAVVLPQDRLRLLVSMAASLSDDGQLPVRELSSDYHWEELNGAKS